MYQEILKLLENYASIQHSENNLAKTFENREKTIPLEFQSRYKRVLERCNVFRDDLDRIRDAVRLLILEVKAMLSELDNITGSAPFAAERDGDFFKLEDEF
jgi:hypothetical protein